MWQVNYQYVYTLISSIWWCDRWTTSMCTPWLTLYDDVTGELPVCVHLDYLYMMMWQVNYQYVYTLINSIWWCDKWTTSMCTPWLTLLNFGDSFKLYALFIHPHTCLWILISRPLSPSLIQIQCVFIVPDTLDSYRTDNLLAWHLYLTCY